MYAGHNPDRKVACGAVGLIYESTEAMNVVSKLITLLQKAGHMVYNCTVDNGTSQSDVLNRIVRKCNSNSVDLEISKLGYKNRGVKVNQGLYFLNNTKAPAMLIECCFVDDADDVRLYSSDKMAKAIATAICGDTKDDEEMDKTIIRLTVNGAAKTLEGFNVGGTNYVTIRGLCDLVGITVGYDSATKTVVLSK